MVYLLFGYIKLVKKIINFIKQHKYLIAILGTGLALQLIGLAHGYPYIFNIDEPALVRSSLGIRFSWFVDHFDWPHLNFYINYVVYELFIKFRAVLQILGLRSTLENSFPVLWSDPFIFYLISRTLNALFSTFAGLPIYLLARKFFDKKYSLIGLLAYMFIPLSLILSKYALQEPAQLFFIGWTVYFAYQTALKNTLKQHLLFGLFLGLAASIKYNAVFFAALPVIFFAFLNNFSKKSSVLFVKNLAIAGLVSLLVLILTTFSVFKYWDVAWSTERGRGLVWQFTENVEVLSGTEYQTKLIENYESFKTDLGGGVFIVSLIGLVGLAFLYIRRTLKKEDINLSLKASFSLALFFVLYFIYTSRYSRSGGHYFMVLLIFIPILFAHGLQVLDSLAQKYRIVVPKNIFMGSIYFIIFAMALDAVLPFAINNNYSDSISYVKEEESDDYVIGEDLRAANSINNLGFKNYEDDSKMNLGDLVITEEQFENENFELLRSFEVEASLNGPVNVYVKNK